MTQIRQLIHTHTAGFEALKMLLIYALAIVVGFWAVLPWDTVFLAPDAPILPLTFTEALRQLFTTPPTLQNLIFLLPYPFAYEATFWIDGFVMCLAAVFLLRSRGSSWGAAWVGGFCAAFAGYFFTLFCAGHRGVVDALAVTCLTFGTMTRLITTPKWTWSLLLALLLAFGLAAQADICFLVTCLLGAYTLKLWFDHRAQSKRILLHLALAAGLFLILGIPALRHTFGSAQTTRTVQLAEASAQGESHDTFITNWSLPPEDLAELLHPHINGFTSYPFDPQPYNGKMGTETRPWRQHALHLGFLTLPLALLAIIKRKRDWCFWTGAVVVSTLLAFGRYTPLYNLILHLPILDQIRAPVKWFHLTGFALAILAGLGYDTLKPTWTKLLRADVLCLLIALGGALLTRHYVFPRDLALDAHPLTAALPPNAILCNFEGGSTIDDICKWNHIPLTTEPSQANCIIVDARRIQRHNPSLRPLAIINAYGTPLALYPYPIPR